MKPSGYSVAGKSVGGLMGLTFALVPLLGAQLNPNDYEGGRSRNVEDRALRNSSAVATMLGEFRTGLSDIVLVKTERYLHSGIGYVPHVNKDLLSVSGATAALDEGHAHHDEGEHREEAQHHDGCQHGDGHEYDGTETLIRTADRDYRGFLGDLHREVKPWRDPSTHQPHTDGEQLLPWFRLVTLSDPQYVRGYSIGGYWLKRIDSAKAVTFLQEGIANNPEAFQLHLILGQVYLAKGRELAGPSMYNPGPDELGILLKARDAYKRAAELAALHRPAGGDEDSAHPSWTHYLEEDARAAFRLAVLTEREYGSPPEAARLARIYLGHLPGDPTLLRIAGPSS